MKRKILIEKKEKKVWTFLLENDSITEIHCTPENDEKPVIRLAISTLERFRILLQISELLL